MKMLIAAFIILFSTSAFAQAPNQTSISEFTLSLTQSITQLGQAATNLQKQNATLQTENAKLREELDRIKSDAKQKPIASPTNGGSSAQPSVRPKSGSAPSSSEGVQ